VGFSVQGLYEGHVEEGGIAECFIHQNPAYFIDYYLFVIVVVCFLYANYINLVDNLLPLKINGDTEGKRFEQFFPSGRNTLVHVTVF